MKSIKSASIISIIVLVGCMVLAPIIVSNEASAQSEGKTLRIGGLVSLTGFFSVRDIPDANETEIAADLINEMGGINIKGQKYLIELVVEDYKSSMDGVAAATNRLVYDKKVKFIIGPTAFFAAATGPICDPNKVIRVPTWVVHSPGEVDSSTPYAFLGCNATVATAIGMAEYLKRAYPDVKKVTYVTIDDGTVPHMSSIAKRILNEKGITIVGKPIVYSNDTLDFSPIAAKINANKGTDAVFHVNCVGPQVGNIIKGLRELGNTMPYAACMPTSLTEVVAIAGKEATKDVFVGALTAGDPDMAPLAAEICKRTTAQYGSEYTLYLTGADGLWDLKQVMEKAQSLDPTVVKATWESMDTIETIFGKGTVCGDEVFGIKHHVVAHSQPIQIIRDGKIVSGGWMPVYIP
jgi:branched-chain amino acid transport system substrate-binding protein